MSSYPFHQTLGRRSHLHGSIQGKRQACQNYIFSLADVMFISCRESKSRMSSPTLGVSCRRGFTSRPSARIPVGPLLVLNVITAVLIFPRNPGRFQEEQGVQLWVRQGTAWLAEQEMLILSSLSIYYKTPCRYPTERPNTMRLCWLMR